MNHFKQIFLEFENDTIYKPSKITELLLEKFQELGNEIILPINMQNENKNIPIFVFSQNPNFQIQGNFYNLVITVEENSDKNFNEIIKSIVVMFKQCNINFVGIACTFQEHINKGKIQNFKKNHFINFELENTDEIHFSIIREIDINKEKTRFLEGYSTLNNEFTIHFEFNMKKENFKILNIEYITKFFDECNDYKEQKKSCL